MTVSEKSNSSLSENVPVVHISISISGKGLLH